MGVYAGATADERRARRRERLLEAALDLAGREGWQAAGVRAVCQRACLTPRYFYESFADRDELLVAVFDAVSQEAAERVVAAVEAAPDDAPAKARAAVEAFVSLLEDDPRKARVMFGEALGVPALERRRREVLRMFAAIIREQGRAFYRAPAGADVLLDTTAYLLAGGLAELLLAWVEGELSADRDELVADVAALIAATGEAAAAIARERLR